MASESLEVPTEKPKTVKGYASLVFKESSVSAVSGIVSTTNKPRKIFRILIFLIFTTGFLYQCIKFFTYVFQYPTVVNIVITKPDTYMTPAYTFCNSNKIKRSKFCAKYPEFCTKPTKVFCQNHPNYCGSNQSMIPKQEYYMTNYTYNENDVLKMGHDLADLLVSPMASNDVEGPYPRYRDNEEIEYSGCYTVNSIVGSRLDPKETTRDIMWHTSVNSLVFNAEEDEVFNPYSDPGILFTVHSPLNAVNPFKKGVFMKPGRLYKITVKMDEERLLPSPYATDCLDYIARWKNNNRDGPRTQKMCKEVCLLDFFLNCHNCSYLSVYPNQYKICNSDEMKAETCTHTKTSFDELVFDFALCALYCKDDCLKIRYIYEVEERSLAPRFVNNTVMKESRYIQVEIEMDDTEVMSLQYQPQYQEVEAFSYVGGFIGIWLGISLVQVADVFESGFRILRYFCKRSRSCALCRRKSSSEIEENI